MRLDRLALEIFIWLCLLLCLGLFIRPIFRWFSDHFLEPTLGWFFDHFIKPTIGWLVERDIVPSVSHRRFFLATAAVVLVICWLVSSGRLEGPLADLLQAAIHSLTVKGAA